MLLQIMTEAFEDGNYLVRVRAQVMTRDDSSGGWVPMGGGGLSNVSVRKRIITAVNNNNSNNNNNNGRDDSVSQDDNTSTVNHRHSTSTVNNSSSFHTKHEYLIYGRRISDQTTVLSCVIKKDFEYNKVMPTFHHWKTGDKRFGLTFQTAADARAFDKGVRTAVQDLLDGYIDSGTICNAKDIIDDDVFMTLNLPLDTPSKISRGKGEIIDTSIDPLQRVRFLDDKELKDVDKGENYSYVQLSALHEYIYPMVEGDNGPEKSCSGNEGAPKSSSIISSQIIQKQQGAALPPSSLDIIQTQQPKAHHYSSPLSAGSHAASPAHSTGIIFSSSYTHSITPYRSISATGGTSSGVAQRCKYCNEYFLNDNTNKRGACDFAPDRCKRGIECVTCLSCAQCMLYHCMSSEDADDADELAMNPCDCTRDNRSCAKRWISLTFLSCLVPCLWCYPPLKACHACCVSCGACGGRHAPVTY